MCAFKKPIPHCPSDGIEMLDTLPRRISKCSVAAYLQRSYKKQAGCHLSHRKFSPASTFLWLFGTNYLFTCLRIHQSALHRLKLLLELFLFKCPLVCISSPAAPVCETLPWTPASCLTRALMFRPRSCLFFICVFPIKVVEPGGSLYWRKCKQGLGLKHFFYRRKCLCIFMNAILGCGWEVHACVEVLKFLVTSCWDKRRETSRAQTTGEQPRVVKGIVVIMWYLFHTTPLVTPCSKRKKWINK